MKVIISVFLSIILACVPCFAYTADSFVIDTDPYLFSKITASSTRSDLNRISVSLDPVPLSFDYDSSDYWYSPFLESTYSLESVIAGSFYVDVPQIGDDGLIDGIVTVPYPFHYTNLYNLAKRYAASSDVIDLGTNTYTWVPESGIDYLSPIAFSFSSMIVSLPDCFDNAIQFSGAICPYHYIVNRNNLYQTYSTCRLLIDGAEVLSLESNDSGYFNFNDFTYVASSGAIGSIELIFGTASPLVEDSFTDNSPGELSYRFYTAIKQDNFSISVLQETDVLDSFNDHTQSDINQHNSIESQWTGSMTQNFNQLSIDTFSFPVAAVSAFTLISGIFTDLWNAMGDFKVVYVFPLTLGIVLLLVGRISKFSGGRSSSSKGKSDDNA